MKIFRHIILVNVLSILLLFHVDAFHTPSSDSTTRLPFVFSGHHRLSPSPDYYSVVLGSKKISKQWPLRAEPISTQSSSMGEDNDKEDSQIASPTSSTELGSSSSSETLLDRPVLAVIDFVALMVFAAIGKASHAAGDGTSFLQETAAVGMTALPFILSWFATSFVTGVYQPIDNESNVLVASWKQTAKGWIVAIPLGCVGRGLIKGYVPPIPFVIVTMISTLIILGLTRTVYNFVAVGGGNDKNDD